MKNIVLAFFIFLCSDLAFGQTIVPVGAPFSPGQDMVFDYTGGTGASTDWIGIYDVGEIPDGDPGSHTWDYIASPAGTLTLAGTLPEGEYTAHLFCCDGYDILASVNFSISGPAPATIETPVFPLAGQMIPFDYSGGTGNALDWIGIYNIGAVPGTDLSLAFQYIPTPEGQVLVDATTIAPGHYEAHLFCCDSYSKLASTEFTIFEDLDPKITAADPISFGQSITFQFEGGTGSQLDWVGLYHHGEVPDGDPPSIAYLYVPGANGEVTFEPQDSLLPGQFYDAHLFCCDGYEIIASYENFEVTSTGVGDLNKFETDLFDVQPSPAVNVINLVFRQPQSGHVSIFNLNGQSIREFDIKNELAYQVTNIPTGTFVILLRSPDGNQALRVIVK